MEQEYFILCALPYTLRASASFHVSLFVAPTIQAGGTTLLGDWPLFRDWAQHVRSEISITLSDQNGPIACSPLLDPVDPDLWRAVFPADLAVRSQQVPRWEDRHWRSFSARTVMDIARGIHIATMLASPADPPAPAAHPLSDLLMRYAVQHEFLTGTGRGERSRRKFDARRMTQLLDGIVESGESLAVIERMVAGEVDWMHKLALELHRCRRFYERPESQEPYRARPDPEAQPARPDLPDSEFHERCAFLGDHPAMLRRLGLVIDLIVDDPARMADSRWLSARLDIRGNADACRTTRLACARAGDDLVAAPTGSDWQDGALTLGDEKRFSVLPIDADGSALKVERLIWTLPNLLFSEANQDPVNAATPSLRSPGFTIAAASQGVAIQHRLARQQQLEAGLADGSVQDLAAEDVMRGFRVEVWDDHSGRWASLHQRLAGASVPGFGDVYSGFAEQGFIQGTAAHETPGTAKAPIHIHEALFGWEGWSLSARRPGNRIRHLNGEEIVEPDEPESPERLVHPVLFASEVAPGTLPRLRYGRSYSFRAWGVDLAGNSRPHSMGHTPLLPVPPVLIPGAGQGTSAPFSLLDTPVLRTAIAASIARRDEMPAAAPEDPESILGEIGEAGHEILDQLRQRRLGSRQERRPSFSIRDALNEQVATVVSDRTQPLWSAPDKEESDALARVMAAHAADLTAGDAEEIQIRSSRTVTRPSPFLRWEPVSSPALVPRRRYTEGESLRVLVIRSGVTQDPATLDIKLADPDQFAAAANEKLTAAGYHGTCERHLAPPKISQIQAELHGKFDAAIGSSDPADHRKMLGWALRENGTFQDIDRADIDNPPNRIAQPGIAIVHVGQPTTELKVLPLAPGEPLAPGQTVIHDVDELGLPYLPDPLARGISLAFHDAGKPGFIPFPFGAEVFTAAYPGDWPEIEPFRLVLKGASRLAADLSGRTLSIMLPPGDIQRFRLASSVTKEGLNLLGPWRSLPEGVRAADGVAEAAADGLLWGLTPFEEVMLVHAVDRPVEAPRCIKLTPIRAEGSTSAWLIGAVDVHGGSTDSLSLEADWTDVVDDLSLPHWQEQPATTTAYRMPIRPYEDIALLWLQNQQHDLEGVGPVDFHSSLHEFGDTRHRLVQYRFRASTRFREYFPDSLLTPADPPAPDVPDQPLDDGQSVVGPAIMVSIPSSARPAPPLIHSVIPLFRWSAANEAEQPLAWHHERRAGVRIYLQRPWYSSGEGEMLAVLLARSGDRDASGSAFVSQWGSDPLWAGAPINQRELSLLQLDDLLHMSGFDDRTKAAQPSQPVNLPLSALPGSPVVTAVGYQPIYNEERELWYVDCAINPGNHFWPFVRLAVARYQPESVAGCHLSAPVRCDFVQLPPERIASVSRTDESHVRVLVRGQVGMRAQTTSGDVPLAQFAEAVRKDRRLVARLQKRDPAIQSDLGWETRSVTELTMRGRSHDAHEVAWVGELDAGETITVVRPGGEPGEWRVAIEEWEWLEADPPPSGIYDMLLRPAYETRLIYADEIHL